MAADVCRQIVQARISAIVEINHVELHGNEPQLVVFRDCYSDRQSGVFNNLSLYIRLFSARFSTSN